MPNPSHARSYRRIIVRHIVVLLAAWATLLGGVTYAWEDPAGDIDVDGDVDVDDLNNLLNRFLATGEFDIDAVANVRRDFGVGELAMPPAPASGATLRLRPAVSSVYVPEEPFAEADWSANRFGDVFVVPGQGEVVAVVDFFMTVGGLPRPGATGWGNVVFDVSGVVSAIDRFGVGYLPNIRLIDHDADPNTPEEPLIQDNLDMGDSRDLMDIVAGVWPWRFGPGQIDRRRTLGLHGEERLGSVFAALHTDLEGTRYVLESTPNFFSTFDENGVLSRNDGELFGGKLNLTISESICIVGDTLPCDGRVHVDDLNGVRNGISQPGEPNPRLGETYPFDGVIDISDLNNVRNNFGAVATAVPEPATSLLMLAGLLIAAPPRLRRLARG